jgi:prepilin-type N-terminal cleavage/methylation domain-containing protein
VGPELEPVCKAGSGADSGYHTAGFTLIELLISVAVLAVLAVGATLALPGGAPRAGNDLALFRSQFTAARQLAITGQQARGLKITPEGLQLALSSDSGWQISERVLPWRGRVAFVARSADQSAARNTRTQVGAPDILLLADGQSTPFDITFTPVFAQRSTTRRCQSDGWTGLQCDEG